MNLNSYLNKTSEISEREEQRSWAAELKRRVKEGAGLFKNSSEKTKRVLRDEFVNRVRTEELKAWYSAPEEDSLFQGTSISSLTIPYEMPAPLNLRSVGDLEEAAAAAYIESHNKHAASVKGAIMEDVSQWLDEGLYYGVVFSSKIISQAFGLSALRDEVVFKVNGHMVDPHEITSYPDNIRRAYFKECLKNIDVFRGLDLEQRELESSLVLADISKPKIERYKDRIILAPIRCNEIAAALSENITARIIEKTAGKIRPKSLAVVIYDTDTPYTYHNIMGYSGNLSAPALPGLIVLGSSGTIDAFRWLYSYRVSLIAQKMMKGSLYSEVHQRFVPFVFFGVLVPRDAEILLDMKNLHRLRYRGNIAPDIEWACLVKNYLEYLQGSYSKRKQI
ncbi:MAG: hypothetical protein V1933_03650 [Candidatus Omnitrophota bacterium]